MKPIQVHPPSAALGAVVALCLEGAAVRSGEVQRLVIRRSPKSVQSELRETAESAIEANEVREWRVRS